MTGAATGAVTANPVEEVTRPVTDTMIGPPLQTPGAALGRNLTSVVDAFTALNPAEWTGSEAVEVAAVIAEQTSRLAAVRLAALDRIRAEGTWALDGSRSAAAWLARADRSTTAAAGGDLKTARLLGEHLPATRAALLSGDLPLAHARAITRTCLRTQTMRATLTDPDHGETFLLDHAHLALPDYQRFLSAWAYRADPDAADAAYREDRDHHEFRLADTTGGVVPSGLLSPVVAQMLRTVLRAEIGVPAAEDTRSHAQRMHDALGSVMARVLAGGALGRTHAVRPQVVVHVPAATMLADPGTPGVPPAWLQDSRTPIPRSELDRIACDSELLAAIIGADGEILRFGRAKRLFDGPLRRALETRDGGCRWPGCHAPACATEGHHLDLWSRGGRTDIDDAALLCWHHHTHCHAHDIRIEKVPDGGLAFYTKTGTLIGITYPRGGPDPSLLPWPTKDETTPNTLTGLHSCEPDTDCRGPT